MSVNNRRPWYKKPAIILPIIIAASGVIAGIIFGIRSTPTPPTPTFIMSIDSLKDSVQQGKIIQRTITVENIIGFNKYTVSLSATGKSNSLPGGMLLNFTPQTGIPKPTYTSNFVVSIDKSVPIGEYEILIKGTGSTGYDYTCLYTLNVEPSSNSEPTSAPTSTTTTATPLPQSTISIAKIFFPSGWMGDYNDIKINPGASDNPHSKPACIEIRYTAAKTQGNGWAGIYWQYPDKNWGEKAGKNLTGMTKLTFWARGKTGKEFAEFKVGGINNENEKNHDSIIDPISTGLINLGIEWQKYVIDLSGQDLSSIIGGFCWVANTDENPTGCTIYLDDIQYE